MFAQARAAVVAVPRLARKIDLRHPNGECIIVRDGVDDLILVWNQNITRERTRLGTYRILNNHVILQGETRGGNLRHLVAFLHASGSAVGKSHTPLAHSTIGVYRATPTTALVGDHDLDLSSFIVTIKDRFLTRCYKQEGQKEICIFHRFYFSGLSIQSEVLGAASTSRISQTASFAVIIVLKFYGRVL